MRANVPQYDLKTPSSLSEALQILQKGDFLPFAGGTDLMVLLEAGKLAHRNFLSLSDLSELQGITADAHQISLGSMVTYSEIRKNPEIQKHFPNLIQSALATGALAIQNRGTIGGNIANASPAADSLPSLLVYNATLEMISTQGKRLLPYQDFHKDYKKTALVPGEIIRAIHLPLPAGFSWHYFRKVGTRKAQAISKVCIAACGSKRDQKIKFHLSAGSVTAFPKRLRSIENLVETSQSLDEILKKLPQLVASEIAPIDDIRSTKHYRLLVAQNLIQDCIQEFLKSP